MRQVAKVDIREDCTELRGDSETDDGDGGIGMATAEAVIKVL